MKARGREEDLKKCISFSAALLENSFAWTELVNDPSGAIASKMKQLHTFKNSTKSFFHTEPGNLQEDRFSSGFGPAKNEDLKQALHRK